mgnify:CR=1 FL=1
MSVKKLIKQLNQRNQNLKNSQCEDIINIILKFLTDSLKKKKTIELRGLGRWYWKTLKENYNARNPSTSELIYKPERIKIRFKASKKINKMINE